MSEAKHNLGGLHKGSNSSKLLSARAKQTRAEKARQKQAARIQKRHLKNLARRGK